MKTLRDAECRAVLVKRINELSTDTKPKWGKMNVEQMLSHLVQGNEFPFVASVPDRSTWASRSVIKPLLLYLVPIPKEVKTSPEMDQQQKGRAPLGFEKDRALVIESINRLATLADDHKCLGHPFFGSMSVKQWNRLAHKHIDHHLRQFGV